MTKRSPCNRTANSKENKRRRKLSVESLEKRVVLDAASCFAADYAVGMTTPLGFSEDDDFGGGFYSPPELADLPPGESTSGSPADVDGGMYGPQLPGLLDPLGGGGSQVILPDFYLEDEDHDHDGHAPELEIEHEGFGAWPSGTDDGETEGFPDPSGGPEGQGGQGAAPNIRVNSIQLRDANGTFVDSIPVGQRVAIQVLYSTEGIPQGTTFDILFDMDGTTYLDQGVSYATGDGNWFHWRSGWYAGAGVRNISVRMDVGSDVFETDETDNFASKQFVPFEPTDLPQKLIFPVAGVRNTDFAINNYADVDPTADRRRDFAGGIFQYDGHSAWDLGPGYFQEQDNGIPILAAADGVVVNSADGHFDRKTSFENTPANFVIIDHGNNWNTIYWHFARDSVAVEPGDFVKAGDVIGEMGSSGISTGVHLHFTLRRYGFSVETMFAPDVYFLPEAEVEYQPLTAPNILRSGISNDTAPTSTDWREGFPSKSRFYEFSSDAMVFHFQFSHLNVGDAYQVRFIRPNGTTAFSRIHDITQQYRFPGWYWWINSGNKFNNTGTWRAQVSLNGSLMAEETFEVLPSLAEGQIRIYDQSNGYVNPGRTTPYDFGSTAGGVQSFRVENHGDQNLQLTEMDVPQGFELVAFPTSVPVGGSGTIAVRYNGGYSRSFGAIRFATTDPDLPEFWFNVEGAATESVPTAAPRLAMLAPAATYQLGTPAVGIDDEANLIAGGSPVAKIYARWEGGRRAGDAMVVRNDGGISVDGADISYDGVKIATIDNPGAAPNDLEIAMLPTVAATNERVLAILEAIGFESSSTESGPRFTRFLVETVDGVESTHAFKTVRAHEQLFDYAEVESVQFGGESQQRSLVNSITVGFDQVVEVQDGAFELRKRGADGGVVDIAISTQDVDNKTVATLTFIGQFSEHSSLVDGNYELMLVGDKIVGPHRQGADVDGDNMRGGVRRIGTVESDRFYRYFGDLDADRTVGFLDYTEFRNTFGDAAGSDDFNEAFDFNADGVIGFVDFSEFRKRFGKSLDF